MTLTGRDIHEAYCLIERSGKAWDVISVEARQKYDEMACILNRMLESDSVSIAEVQCPDCGEMLVDLQGHSCLQEEVYAR
jgi:uncharacterized protein with PIN domain